MFNHNHGIRYNQNHLANGFFDGSKPPKRKKASSDSGSDSDGSDSQGANDGVTKSNRKKGKGGSSCHQCKSRRNYVALTYCTSNLDKKNKNCRKKFCEHCLKKFYKESPEQIHDKTTWKCPSCRKICCCAACKRRRMKDDGMQEASQGMSHDVDDGKDDSLRKKPKVKKPLPPPPDKIKEALKPKKTLPPRYTSQQQQQQQQQRYAKAGQIPPHLHPTYPIPMGFDDHHQHVDPLQWNNNLHHPSHHHSLMLGEQHNESSDSSDESSDYSSEGDVIENRVLVDSEEEKHKRELHNQQVALLFSYAMTPSVGGYIRYVLNRRDITDPQKVGIIADLLRCFKPVSNSSETDSAMIQSMSSAPTSISCPQTQVSLLSVSGPSLAIPPPTLPSTTGPQWHPVPQPPQSMSQPHHHPHLPQPKHAVKSEIVKPELPVSVNRAST